MFLRALLRGISRPRAIPTAASSSYAAQYKASITNPDAFWAEEARKTLLWRQPFDQVSNNNLQTGLVSWFRNGKLNASGWYHDSDSRLAVLSGYCSENCIDRHLADHGQRTALIWEQDEPGKAKKASI